MEPTVRPPEARLAPRRARLAWRAFDHVIGPLVWRGVRGVHLTGVPREVPAGVPLLLVANHTSWWDGFLLRQVQRYIRPDAAMHAVMLERELRRSAFLRAIGCVGIAPDSAGSLLRAMRLLRDERRRDAELVVAYFPQGRIWPSARRPLGFRRGVATLARLLAPVTVLPVGIHLEMLAARRPSVFISVGAPVPVESPTVTDDLAARLEALIEVELDGILDFLARHGEDAPRRWPGVHAALPASHGSPAARARPHSSPAVPTSHDGA